MKDEDVPPRTPGEPPEDAGEITIEFVDHEEPPARVEAGAGLQLPPAGERQGSLEAEEAGAAAAGPSPPERIAELEDQLLRLRAEFANFRRRVERDRADYLRQAKAEATSALLPVLDDLDRAVEALDPGVPERFAHGLVLVRQRMLEALRRLGLEEIDAGGGAFDPGLHEAVSTVRRVDLPPMTVTKVFARGYRLGGKVLKPARVEVNSGPEPGPPGEDHA